MADVEVASVLPKELRLGVPPKMPQARSYMFRQQSTLSSYNNGDTIQINIPRLQRSYLRKDSYLRFTLVGNWTPGAQNQTAVSFDTCGAFGLIEKIEVFDYLGSTVLESSSGVPQLMSLLMDLGLSTISDKNIGNSSMGLAQDYVASRIGSTSDNPSTGFASTSSGRANRALSTQVSIDKTGSVVPPSSGATLDWKYQATQQTFVREFAIPLPSFLGLLSDKMIPLHNGFTIILTLATKNKPFIVGQVYAYDGAMVARNAGPSTALNGSTLPNSTATLPVPGSITATLDSWSLKDVNMVCQILELGPVAESMMMSSTQGQPFIVSTKAMRYYQGSITGGASSQQATPPASDVVDTYGQAEFTLNLNLNVASLTNILWFMRSKGQIDDIKYASCGHRTRNFLQRWVFQYGSTSLPQNNGIQSMFTSLPTGVTTTDVNAKYGILGSGFTEAYNELMKARPVYLPSNKIDYVGYDFDNKFNSSLDCKATGAITSLNWFAIYPSPNHPFGIGRFACGLNLELANNKHGTVISGLNTNGMNTSIRGYFHPNYLVNMDSVVVDAYAEYDAFINISPGIATTVSF